MVFELKDAATVPSTSNRGWVRNAYTMTKVSYLDLQYPHLLPRVPNLGPGKSNCVNRPLGPVYREGG